MFLSAKTPLVAVDIGSHSVKVAQLAKPRDKYELVSFGMLPLEPETVIDGVIKKEAIVSDAISNLLKAEKIQTKYAVVSVVGEAVIIKKIRVPLKSYAELTHTIKKEAEQYVPFDIDDVSVDFQILDRGSKQAFRGEDEGSEADRANKMDILLVAVQKETIDNRVGVLRDAGLKSVIVDLDIFALVNALAISQDLTKLGTSALIDLGSSFTHMNILQEGMTSFTRDITMGGGLCTKKLMTKFDLQQPEAEALKRGEIPEKIDKQEVLEIITDSYQKIIEEIEKSFDQFSSTTGSAVGQVYLSGGGALIPGAENLFQSKLRVPVEILNPWENIDIDPKKFDRETISQMGPIAAVAIGLATRKFDYE